jgi:tetratricopeptide (TPR) repeat protein
MRYLKKAVDVDPNRAEYHLYVGWAANEANPADLGLARQEIEAALKLDRLLGDGYWQLGVLERKQSQVDDAIRHLKRALELKPNRFEAHAALADCYGDKNDTTSAMAEWKKAIEADDQRPYWRYRYGRLLVDRSQWVEASKHLGFAAQTAEKDSPRPGWLPDCEFNAGEAFRKTGKKTDAIERYNAFMQVADTNSPDRRDAIKALQELGAPYTGRNP